MLVLAIDISTVTPVVALGGLAGPIVVGSVDPGPAVRHGRRVVPLIREVLDRAGAGLPDVIGVGLGPGSFTGLRVGLMAAKTLAYAWGRPLAGFDSLEAVARGGLWTGEVAVAADAQRGGLFAGRYRRTSASGEVETVAASDLVEPMAWLESLGVDVPICTSDPERLRRLLGEAMCRRLIEVRGPSAEAIVGLTERAAGRGEWLDPFFAEPSYGRPSAAEEKSTASL